ncbi:TetR/AcrR family transcriptional regulator [Streptomyces lydicus]|uniref:Transcriptional regulator n=1 Tax=Streptomyces lydicus TaxID=47763 RepID=A0A1D7VP23_9ACTN|nr:TetR/AcrR family transcriptional regulator [Streptomyces lydicus]AOP48492.1 transcriptional regulator [Streptomyces lydicus]
MAKNRYHHGELRAALLDAAESLVGERGAAGWSLREASLRVGVSPSAAYHHFGSRDELVGALSARVLDRLGARLSAAVDEAPDGDQGRLVAYARGYVTWALDGPAVARLAFDAGDAAGGVAVHPHDVLAGELDRLVDAGTLRPSAREGAEFLLWAAIHGLAALLVDGLVHFDDRTAVDLHAERLVRTVLNGLAQEEAEPGGRPQARSAHTVRLAQRAAAREPRGGADDEGGPRER